MVSYKTSMAAFVAALGMGSAASAAVISINHTFYNASFSTRRFEMTVELPGTGIGSGGIEWRKVGGMAITLSDLNGNGATLTNAGQQPIYQVDGVTVKTLNASPWVWQWSTPFDSRSTVPINYSEALPPGVNPAGTLGLATTFDLSAGDAAYVSATFEIPAPAPAALIAIAGLVGSRRRRRG
jgi:MYXO-CTERM domain-containing protein